MSPVNVCVGGAYQAGVGLYSNSCFTTGGYGSPASAGLLNGQNPDTYIQPGSAQTVDAAGGVAPIDISANLSAGSQTVAIALSDQGGWLTNSGLFLTTNCTQGGVTGPATVTGNPIPQNPTSQQLDQDFDFNTGNNQVIGFTYDLSGSQAANTLTIPADGPIPQVSDSPMDASTFQTVYEPYTSFATAKCLIHTGELTPNGQPACKLFTLECKTGTGSTASGAQCPASTIANEVVQDTFDGPSFNLPDIHARDGRTFHQGIGFLMASEGWTGGPCAFDPASNLNLPCPLNLLTSFSGPGTYSGKGETTHPNSTFISIAGVPEDLTDIHVQGEWLGGWTNTRTPSVTFHSQPPNLAGTRITGTDVFIPSPIQSITFGLTAAGDMLPSPANEPIQGDTILTNPAVSDGCPVPTSGNPDPLPATDFDVQQTLSFPADGRYILHYYAQDCAGTQELKFAKQGGSWTTNFYIRNINIDTTAPVVSPSTLTLVGNTDVYGNYKVGEVVRVSYSCTDATTGSGVVFCGERLYFPGTNYSTGTLTHQVDTHTPGTKTYTVFALDGAGNSTSESVTYTVVK
jgi:hypothetical protein